jgi:hypothetical protein
MLRIVLTTAIVTFAPTIALANGAYAAPPGIDQLRIIGFSEDGDYFAFETYGIDGYGAGTYAFVQVLDTRTNELDRVGFVLSQYDPAPPGDGDRVSLVREEALRQAQLLFGTIGFDLAAPQPGRVLATNAMGEIARSAEFVVYPGFPLAEEGVRLSVGDTPLPRPDICPDLQSSYVGLRLELTDLAGNANIVHHDEEIAGDRGCPLRYTLSDILIFDPGWIVVVLVNRFDMSIEGPVRRITAVAFELPEGPGLR